MASNTGDTVPQRAEDGVSGGWRPTARQHLAQRWAHSKPVQPQVGLGVHLQQSDVKQCKNLKWWLLKHGYGIKWKCMYKILITLRSGKSGSSTRKGRDAHLILPICIPSHSATSPIYCDSAKPFSMHTPKWRTFATTLQKLKQPAHHDGCNLVSINLTDVGHISIST